MSLDQLLALYCALIMLASLAGGWLPMCVRLTHTQVQLAISFIGGAMLGVGLLHLLPHAVQELGSISIAARWALGGFLFMFFVERVFHFHHHDVPPVPPSDHSLPHEAALHQHHEHHHHSQHDDHPQTAADADRAARAPLPRLSWGPVLAGLALHSVLDGVALAASVTAETHASGNGLWAGLVVFLAVWLHKPFDSLTLGSLMAVAGRGNAIRHTVNALYALAVPVGVLAFRLGLDVGGGSHGQIVGVALAFAAGTFICIATSDLLPELHFHTHDRLKLSAALLLGVCLAAALESGHEHHPASSGSDSGEHEHK